MAKVPGAQLTSASVANGVMMDGDAKTQLRSLTAQATLKYSVKDYSAAADLYSQATELQAEINGELSPHNADLLYAYGRCLYHVAVKNSDVLGSKVAGEKREEGQKWSGIKKQRKQQGIDEIDEQQNRIAKEVVRKVAEPKDGAFHPDVEADRENKPYFQFRGDENFDTSDEEQEEEGAEADVQDVENADGEDDFLNAYEVLDLARVLFMKKLEEVANRSGKRKEKCELQQVQQLKERLADTYDLQAEISLEGERFPDAVMDLRSALELKKALFPQESSLVAEAHYKLSLALEFSSVTQPKTENGDVHPEPNGHVDESLRVEAALEMEEAIASCRMRIKQEETILVDASEADRASGKAKITNGDIADVKEVVKEMEQRLVELRQPPVSIDDQIGTGTIDGSNPLSGILGSILGESPAAQQGRLEDASKGAKDLTGLIKRKKPTDGEGSEVDKSHTIQSNGKRKVDLRDAVEELPPGKREKV